MSTYVMSDIHGCFYEFLEMLLKIEFSKKDKLYILGDVIDRGDEPIKLLQHVLYAENIELLMGNHERFMLDAASKNEEIRETASIYWNYNGGGITVRQFKKLSNEEQQIIIDKLSKLEYYKMIVVDDKEFLLSHSGVIIKNLDDIEKDILRECESKEILWHREEMLNAHNESKYIMIHGHTRTGRWRKDGKHKIYFYDNGKKINIDCGCAIREKLGCLRLDDMKEFYVDCEKNFY